MAQTRVARTAVAAANWRRLGSVCSPTPLVRSVSHPTSQDPVSSGARQVSSAARRYGGHDVGPPLPCGFGASRGGAPPARDPDGYPPDALGLPPPRSRLLGVRKSACTAWGLCSTAGRSEASVVADVDRDASPTAPTLVMGSMYVGVGTRMHVSASHDGDSITCAASLHACSLFYYYKRITHYSLASPASSVKH